ncbi:PREDICTED: uncharacterized protein LOC109344540 [Lupinus angustifolius]|uniref:uncharacterized protein LOC109344540 n=1 Tax=Lupinus angustifolius TaxID=3871 RepID=UPI00092F20C9|nr:PREDICTED: uncharacterized protein LOC109344540 [Lupinus angustifolius]
MASNEPELPTSQEASIENTSISSYRGNQIQLGRIKGKGHIGNYFMPRTTPGAQPTLKSVIQSKEVIEKCDLAISKWMIDVSVSFNATNSAYYQPMIDALCSMGPGYKGPNYYCVCGHLLNNWVEDVKKLVNDYRSIWKRTGCTLMADGWTVFIESVDASHASKTADLLFKLFKEIVLYVGPENIVHIRTDNAVNYVAAGRLLEREFPHIYCEDKSVMDFLYQAFFKAKNEMERRFQRNKTKIKPYLEIMDSRWDLQLKRNLHADGYWLNPQCFFNVEEFEKYKFTTSDLLDVLEKHAHGDPDLLDKLTSEMRIYKDAELDFANQ